VKIVSQLHKSLSEPTEIFDFSNPPFDPYEFQKEMLSFMIMNNYLSLGANQVGVNYKIIAVRAETNLVFFNPIIRFVGDELVSLHEASPNFPKLKVNVSRPDEIRLHFQTASGGSESRTYKGLTSRLIQHHMDYLNNYPFWKRSGLYYRNRAEKLLNNMRKENK
jgi:peptide deformylase